MGFRLFPLPACGVSQTAIQSLPYRSGVDFRNWVRSKRRESCRIQAPVRCQLVINLASSWWLQDTWMVTIWNQSDAYKMPKSHYVERILVTMWYLLVIG